MGRPEGVVDKARVEGRQSGVAACDVQAATVRIEKRTARMMNLSNDKPLRWART